MNSVNPGSAFVPIQFPLVLKTKKWGTLPLAISVFFHGLGQ